MNVDIVMGARPCDRKVIIDGVDIAPQLVGPVVIRANPAEMTRADVTIIDESGLKVYRCLVIEVLEGDDVLAVPGAHTHAGLDDITGAAHTSPKIALTGTYRTTFEDGRQL